MKIAFAGGGTAGHVNPNLAIIERCRRREIEVVYLGGADGIERELVEREGVPFHSVPSERLRRYADWRTLLAPFKVTAGIAIAAWRLQKIRPDVLFSKGGFAAFPVVVGAWLNRIPVIAHESDLTPGLANRMSHPFVKKICVGFRQTVDVLGEDKAVYTGSPIRDAFAAADTDRAIAAFGLDPTRPLLLVFGGSQGAQHINETLRAALPELITDGHQVVHACGAGHLDPSLDGLAHYHQREYIHEGFPDLMALARLVICRAGANSLAELLLLGKPSLLIPLPTRSSRGDQLANAIDFQAQGFAGMILDEALSPETLVEETRSLLDRHGELCAAMAASPTRDAAEVVLDMLVERARR